MSTRTQKALLLEKKGGEYVVRDVPIYTPGSGQILIKVQAAGLNPLEWKIRKYGYYVTSYPTILGFDVAGDVEELGEGVTKFKKGDKVFFHKKNMDNQTGGYQQYAISDIDITSKIPEGFSYAQIASLPTGLSAAYSGLYAVKPNGAGLSEPTSGGEGKYTGTPIIILGGASSVGQIVIQLVKLSGFSPIIVTASEKNSPLLTSLGATHVLDRSLDSSALSDAISKITEGRPVSTVFDTISTPITQKLGLGLTAKGGDLVILTNQSVTQEEVEQAGVQVARVIGSHSLPWNVKLLGELYRDRITGWLEKGIIKASISVMYSDGTDFEFANKVNEVEILPRGLGGIWGGLDRLENNQVSAVKLIVNPQETEDANI